MKKIKDKQKRIRKNNFFCFLLGLIVAGTASVAASAVFPSNSVTYDNKESGLSATDVQGAIDELYNTCISTSGTIAIDKITNLLSNKDELYMDDHGNIRYYGNNPNNYVTFNNELWRILGVIDGKVKIIRHESIGEIAWASNGINNWNNASLKTYLNGTYYNEIDFTYQQMISEETYYLGGQDQNNFSSLTASLFYNIERSNNVYSGNPTSTIQRIGLMYPSDYGYATGNSCLTTPLFNYRNSCKNSDYLFSGYTEWTQSPPANANVTGTVLFNSGYIYGGIIGINTNQNIRPSLYLISEVKITNGDGSQNNPYTLSL